MRLLVVDNLDSFTYNLVHYLEGLLQSEVSVIRNTEIDILSISEFDKVVISPGPGLPNETKNLLETCFTCIGHQIPTLGVCLGHQALWETLGGNLIKLERVKHGESSKISFLTGNELFEGLQNPIQVAHYHSWVVDESHKPPSVKIIARDSEGIPMAFVHDSLPISGVQFHPESIMTPHGLKILENWLIEK